MNVSKNLTRKSNPIERANPVSRVTFGYTFGIFKRGFKKDLEEDDIYEVIKSCRSEKLGDKTEKQWTKSNSLAKLLFRRFGKQYLTICIISIIWTEINSIFMPMGLGRLIAYFRPHQKEISQEQAYYYVALVISLKVVGFIVVSNLNVFQTLLGMKILASLKSLLYRKALNLSPSSSGAHLGNLITLITKDIANVEEYLWNFKNLTIFVLQFTTIGYLMHKKLGDAAFIGLGIIALAVPIQVYLCSKMNKIRMKIQAKADERLQRMQETLSAIKVIKMYTWESLFFKKVSESRKKEMRNLIKIFTLHNANLIISIATTRTTFCILIFCYILLGHSVDAELVYYVANLFQQLMIQFGLFLPAYFMRFVDLFASLRRLNRLLQEEELRKGDVDSKQKPLVMMQNVFVLLGDKILLNGISVKISEPGLIVVTGPLGSGKSLLLKTILGEVLVTEGDIKVSGTISYASQDPWLFPSTLRQNIVFGEEYDPVRYNEVVRVCGLEYDFSVFDNGDLTIVSDNGMNLSKGQQARINLARAVYRCADIYLFDDSLTALDNCVQEFIFSECILKFLRRKICVLVSQNPLHVERASKLIFLANNGQLRSEELGNIEIKNDITIIDNVNDKIYKSIKEDIHLSNEMLELEEYQNQGNIYREEKKSGTVGIYVYRKYIEYAGGFVILGLIITFYVIVQATDIFADKYLSNWVDLQQKVLDLKANTTTLNSILEATVLKKDHSFNLYVTFSVLRALTVVVKYYALLVFCQRGSVKLYKVMMERIIHAKMLFFDNHFIGNILNRFSLDTHNIDEVIPYQFPLMFNCIFSTLGGIILLIAVNPLFVLPAVIYLILLLIIIRTLLPTSRSLKRLEAATRSPLVGHITSSLDGLTTIRAFGAQNILKTEFDRHQDLYTSAMMTKNISMFGLGFVIEICSTLFSLTIIVYFLLHEKDTTSGNVGLVLSQVFELAVLVEWIIKYGSDLETNMTSVERVLEYTRIDQEPNHGEVLANWPTAGSVRFKNVSLYYEGCKSPVLKSISFEVKPKERIGIIGRTGAGKSSIISVLYRLYEFHGQVEIDGADTKTLSLECLRKNISIIPQDPVLFSGTIRQNIDPNHKHRDDQLWDIIDKVGLKETVPSLETIIDENGFNYSSGQKQLVCLARAAIAKCKILVMDEASANMDQKTEKILYDVVNEIFSDCTILMIAHRLHLISNCDKVLVLDNGNLIEFDNPEVLKSKEDSLFRKMCLETETAK